MVQHPNCPGNVMTESKFYLVLPLQNGKGAKKNQNETDTSRYVLPQEKKKKQNLPSLT
jgi:hypothetical protein